MPMRGKHVRFVCVSLISLVLCNAVAGCGPSYPYYTLKGSRESRVVVIHLAEGDTVEVPVGTGMGGGLTAEHKAAATASSDGEAVVEQGLARVTVSIKGPMGAVVTIKKVEYDGEEVLFHEPIL